MFMQTALGRHANRIILLFCSVTLFGQQKPVTGANEFPVFMQQKIVAGKTAAGTKVEAKLSVATLVNGVVVPRNAVFSGEVIQSVAKSDTEPSRLAIRMDSVRWKKGSANVKLYLTGWYYPVRMGMGPNLSYEPPDAANVNTPRNWNGQGTYPDPESPASQPFPGRQSGSGTAPAAPASYIEKYPVPIKNVEAARYSDGSIVLASKTSNIKLDKLTTYVLISAEILPTKK
jgi:hypothetical protein